jgi:uncharacterized repeat protein (TIGR01451 family)
MEKKNRKGYFMKRIVISLLLLAAILTGVTSVYAAEAEISVQVVASKTEVRLGETVEYTVLATGSGVVAMQFEIRFPEGLRYVPNSGATPEKLAQKLGVPAADWTEVSKMFTFYNDIGITFAKGTEILRFSCVAEKEGELAPELYELLPFDGDFEEFVPSLHVQKVQVTAKQEQTTAPLTTEQTTPPVVDQTEPTATAPEVTVTPSEPDTIVATTDPTSLPDGVDEEPTVGFEPDQTVQTPSEEQFEEDQRADPEEITKPEQNQHNEKKTAKSTALWIVPLAAVTVIAAAATIYLLRRKKTT